MGRWHPGARGRLERAAHELFRERGFAATTVAQISERAGLTERTFFRHFGDKREVLFSGAAHVADLLVATVEATDADVSAMHVVRRAIEALANALNDRRALARELRGIVAAHADLQERDLKKRAALAAALDAALVRRRVPAPTARIAAELGIAVFYAAYERWTDVGDDRELVAFVGEDFDRAAALLHAN